MNQFNSPPPTLIDMVDNPIRNFDPNTSVLDITKFKRRTPVVDGPPTRPAFMLTTSFECGNLALKHVIDKIQTSLSNIPEIASEYIADKYTVYFVFF